MICQIYNSASPGLRLCRHYNPADIVAVDAVKHLSFAFDDARRAIPQAVERAAPGAINTGGAKNFRVKQLLPSLLCRQTGFAAGGGRVWPGVFIADAIRLVGIHRCRRNIAHPASKTGKVMLMQIEHWITAGNSGDCS